MNRRTLLAAFLLGLGTKAKGEEGLLFDSPVAGSGMLLDAASPPAAKKVVHVYSPETWHCPFCEAAIKSLSTEDDLRVVVHKNDKLPTHFSTLSFPVLHWGSGSGYQSGWSEAGKAALLDKIRGTAAAPKKMQVAARSGGHWSIGHDWSPSREKVISHLIDNHGYRREDIEHLNHGQLLTLHDLTHEGKRSSGKVQQGQSCPTGTYPTYGRFLWWRFKL